MQRACDGLHTDALRASCFRGTPVERARVCSSVVRSAFVRRSVASCVAFVLCWFVWRSCAADSPRACDGLLTGGGRAGIRLMPTFCDIPRWAAARRRTALGRETDTPRATHGRTTGGARASLRTSDGRATGGLRSDLDESSYPKMGGDCAADLRRTYLRTSYGRITGGTRTHNGLLTDCTRACLRTSDGRAAVAGRPPYHGRADDGRASV